MLRPGASWCRANCSRRQQNLRQSDARSGPQPLPSRPLAGRGVAGAELAAMWRAGVITIFPEMFPGPLGLSLAGKAKQKGIWSLDSIDLRDFATDRHRTVDDTPAGGGPGMVMKPDVIARAIDAVATDDRPRLLMSPRGAPLTQRKVA